MNRGIKYKVIPVLVLLLTSSIALLHFNTSRNYNSLIATFEMLIILTALIIYKKDFLRSFPVKSPGFIISVLFILVLFVSSYHSDFSKHVYKRAFSIGMWICYFWLVVFLLKKQFLRTEHLIYAIITSILIVLPLMVYQYSSLDNVSYRTFVYRHLEQYSNIRHFGYHLLAGVFFSCYLMLKNWQEKRWLFFFWGCIVCSLLVACLLSTESRQGIGILLLFSSGIVIYSMKRGFKLNSLLPIIITTIAGVSLLLVLDLDSNFTQMYSRTNTENIDGFLGERLDIWIRSIGYLDNHWLFGRGPESFYHIERQNSLVQPHSVIVLLLLESGITGTLLFAILLLFILIMGVKVLKCLENKSLVFYQSLIAFLFIIAYLLNSLFDGIFYHVLPVYMFSMASAIIVSSYINRFDENKLS